MRKEYLILAVFVLFVWAVRDKVPPQLQFWKTFTTMITVQNNSDHDLSDVTLIVRSAPLCRGALTRGGPKSITTPRLRDVTDVIIRFKYASEPVERLAGTLDEDTDYRMNIQVNFAGVVTAQIGTASTAGSGGKSSELRPRAGRAASPHHLLPR